MLGLAEQIGGDERRIGAVVGDDQDLGRPGGQVDADHAEQLALCLGDVGIAGAGDHVHGAHADAAVCHGAEGLYAADGVDLVGPGLGQGIERERKDAARIARRRRADDVRHARHLGGGDAHDGRRNERILAARHVAADRLDGNDLLAERDAVADLGLELVHGVALALGELDHLMLAEGEVLLEYGAGGAPRRIDVGGADAELGALPAVEIAGIAPHGVVAVLFDVVEHGPHAVGKCAVVLARPGFRLLEILDHGRFSFLADAAPERGHVAWGDAATSTRAGVSPRAMPGITACHDLRRMPGRFPYSSATI